jgi:tetratricopeptide (TPR) repeat protein
MTLARDQITFPVAANSPLATAAQPEFPEWQRWNDYGIGLLRKGGTSKGELRGAEEAFKQVEALGRPDGPLNLARVYIAQGTVRDQAIAALERAAAFEPPAPPWSIAWFTGQVNEQNGNLDAAIDSFRSIIDADTAETRERNFDFSLDYRLLNRLGLALFERSNFERGEERKAQRDEYLEEALSVFQRAIEIDPENVTAHYNLSRLYQRLGNQELGDEHLALYQKYKPDDNARDRVIAKHRAANPAADHAAQAIVIYDLQRPGAYELDGQGVGKAEEFALHPSSSGPVAGVD